MRKNVGFIGVGLAAACFVAVAGQTSLVLLLSVVCIYASVNLMWAVIFDTAGIQSFATLAIFGVGGYAAALASMHWDTSWWIGVLIGGGVAAVGGVFIALPAMRLRGVYVALLTIGFVELCRAYSATAEWLGAANGLRDADQFIPSDLQGTREAALYGFAASIGVLLVTAAIHQWLDNGRIGLLLKTVRESEPLAQSWGISVAFLRLQAFAITSAVLGLLGGYYIAFTGSINGQFIFSFDLLLLLFAMLVIGGISSMGGIITGAFVVSVFDYMAVDLGVLRLVVLGIAVLVVVQLAPGGIGGIPGQISAWIAEGDDDENEGVAPLGGPTQQPDECQAQPEEKDPITDG